MHILTKTTETILTQRRDGATKIKYVCQFDNGCCFSDPPGLQPVHSKQVLKPYVVLVGENLLKDGFKRVANGVDDF